MYATFYAFDSMKKKNCNIGKFNVTANVLLIRNKALIETAKLKKYDIDNYPRLG
jgi:hypothetical protein